jgi:hypothetical protein
LCTEGIGESMQFHGIAVYFAVCAMIERNRG